MLAVAAADSITARHKIEFYSFYSVSGAQSSNATHKLFSVIGQPIAGKHSPFAKQFIEALQSRGGNDGILTLSEVMTFIEKLKTAPQSGRFGSDKQGSEFVFVVK